MRNILRYVYVFLLIAISFIAIDYAHAAVFIDGYRYSSGGGSSCNGLECTTETTVFDLDATASDSYGGSGQTWANRTLTPADGSTSSAYNFFLGATSSATTDDPLFNGSAGSSSAYWSFDGGDDFEIQSTPPAFIKSLHKTTGGQDFWIIMVFHSDGTWATTDGFFTTGNSSSVPGIAVRADASERLSFAQVGDTSQTNCTACLTGFTSGDYLVAISYNHSTNTWLYAKNSATLSSSSVTFNTTTTDSGSITRICRGYSTDNRCDAGTLFYAFAMGNSVLDDTTLASICSYYNSRHGRTYC